MQQSEDTQQDHDHANVPQATAQALALNTAVIGGEEGDSEGGKRADGAEKGRVTQVNNGHSRSTTVTRKPALTWYVTS